ncbi:MAG: UDP-N-acetylmuramoyl-tripeptide--D-alanyl-D-alanine ligase [Victivallales bacterium]|nr:UDP-N-acetylmuramoyl-tripeptide--D-alanyl-D-alanine ligase [Victivallales bacterium]
MQLTFKDLSGLPGGRWLVEPESGDGMITAVCDDSRKLAPGAIFVAIAGELTDGHRYVAAALEAGASGIIVQQEPDEAVMSRLASRPCPCLLVPDSLRAFQQLALKHLQSFSDLRVLAITGSCGKTSTKEMLAAVLSRRWPERVLKTLGNTNNHFGVPRNLFRINESTAAAVIEMGTNHPGEIANLVSLAPPQVALVSNIGHAHLEFFHNLEGVATEKGDILAGILPGGTAVFPQEAVGAEILRAKAGDRRIITFGTSDDADVQYTYCGYKGGNFRLKLFWRATGIMREVVWGIGGAHMASNAAAAAAAATAMGLTPEEIVSGLEACVLPGQRQEIFEVKGVHWVNDAYNSNPDSCRASIGWFAEVTPKLATRVLVLGDMRELGENAHEAHKSVIAEAVAKCPDAQLITVGEEMRRAVAALNLHGILSVDDVEEVRKPLENFTVDGAWILLKGSHSINLPVLCPAK